jgi:hypothetical protein
MICKRVDCDTLVEVDTAWLMRHYRDPLGSDIARAVLWR